MIEGFRLDAVAAAVVSIEIDMLQQKVKFLQQALALNKKEMKQMEHAKDHEIESLMETVKKLKDMIRHFTEKH
eukprot:m51a1_g13219 hypothetical protein (73) ;mRNA; f:393-2369